MKEFDFVKLTLWLAGVLTLGLAAGYFYLGHKAQKAERDIKSIELICKDVGLLAKDIKTLEDEKRSDKLIDVTDTSGITSYFYQHARKRGIEANEDYLFKPREPTKNKGGGWVDQDFLLEFKKDRPKHREQLMAFIYDCETQSRRIKLQKAKFSLDPEMAPQDLWRADSLTFTRRDPSKTSN